METHAENIGLTLNEAPALMAEFHQSNRLSFSDTDKVPSYAAFITESTLERILIHLLELKPIGIRSVVEFMQSYRMLNNAPQDSSTQMQFMRSLDMALGDTAEPETADVSGYPFSFARPGYYFLSSRKLRSFFPNVNASVNIHTSRKHLIREHLKAIDEIKGRVSFDKLGFIDKAFGPLGSVELRFTLMEETQLPSVVFRSYAWHRSSQPLSTGTIEKGDRLCVIYDVGISGGLIKDFADYARAQGAEAVAAVVFFDFGEEARDRLETSGIVYRPLIQKQDVCNEIGMRYRSLYKREFHEFPTDSEALESTVVRRAPLHGSLAHYLDWDARIEKLPEGVVVPLRGKLRRIVKELPHIIEDPYQ